MQCNRPSHPKNKVAGVGLVGKSLVKDGKALKAIS